MGNDQNKEFTDANVESLMRTIIERVKTRENPDTLKKYYKLFKRRVPLSLRSYVVGYMTQTMLNTNDSLGKSRRAGSFSSNRANQPRARRFSSDSENKTLFMSVGRNRNIYPRDIIGLITRAARIERERIGDIRILENYTFVQINGSDADAVISALDGYFFRGRKLSASYARKNDCAEETRAREKPDGKSELDSRDNPPPRADENAGAQEE